MRSPEQSGYGIHRALHAAFAAEQRVRAFYRRMVEAYGSRAPFPALLAASEKRVGWLTATCRRHGTPCPADTFSGRKAIGGDWLGNCRRAAAGEAALSGLYQELLPYAGSPDIAGLFDKLLRHSLDHQLPQLLRAVAAASETERFHAAHGIPPEEAYLKHGLLSGFLEKTFSILGAEHRAFGLVAPIVRNASPALLTGLAVGGAMAYALKKKSPSKRKEG